MNFGEQLRQAREARGWSRFMLHLKVKEHGVKVSECAIKWIETGRIKTPRGRTRGALALSLPELTETNPN